jgi:hypothetical protein
MALKSTQPPTEMSTRNLPGGKKRPARKADNLAAIYEPNVGASTSRNPKGLHGLYRDNFNFYFIPRYERFTSTETILITESTGNINLPVGGESIEEEILKLFQSWICGWQICTDERCDVGK